MKNTLRILTLLTILVSGLMIDVWAGEVINEGMNIYQEDILESEQSENSVEDTMHYLQISENEDTKSQDVISEEEKEVVKEELKAPVIKVNKKAYDSLHITFAECENATRYEIQRSTKKDSGYKTIATTTSTSYIDEDLKCGKTYYYKVRAVNENITSDYSEVVSNQVSPAKTTIKSYKLKSYNSTYIQWEEVIGADAYRVYRATSPNGTYKRIVTTTSLSYTDKSLSTGKTYYYKVRAYSWADGSKVFGQYSDVFELTPKLNATTIASYNVKSYNSTYIKWNKVSGASAYRVYRATSPNGTFERLVTTTSLSYTDKGLDSGKTYYYRVRAYRWVGGSKVFGQYSNIFELKPEIGVPTIEAKQSGTKVNVKISKIKDATGYEIYKSNSLNGKYTKIATTKSTSYKDYDIAYTQEYYYKVRAYNSVSGKKVYSEYTEPINVKTYIPATTLKITREDLNRLKMTWDKSSGFSGYEIYISNDNLDYKVLKDITSYNTNSYTTSDLELNKTYYLKARCYRVVDGVKLYSKDSNVVEFEMSEFLPALKSKYNCTVRSSASSSSKSVGTIYKNQIVLSYGMEGNYYKIKVNSKFGYIHKDNVSKYKDAKVIAVSNINQFSYQGGAPLPMGCEVTSLAVVLRYLGFSKVTKNLLADNYQPMGAVGKTDPNVAFVGTPYSSRPYGCYAPVIVKTANNYFKDIGNDDYQVNNLTGMDIEDLYKEIDKGNPLVMWITYGKPYKQESWTLKYGTKTTKEGEGKYKFTWYGLQHCVALAGYNKKKGTLIIADVGEAGELREYSISYLKPGYDILGKQVVSITKK